MCIYSIYELEITFLLFFFSPRQTDSFVLRSEPMILSGSDKVVDKYFNIPLFFYNPALIALWYTLIMKTHALKSIINEIEGIGSQIFPLQFRNMFLTAFYWIILFLVCVMFRLLFVVMAQPTS